MAAVRNLNADFFCEGLTALFREDIRSDIPGVVLWFTVYGCQADGSPIDVPVDEHQIEPLSLSAYDSGISMEGSGDEMGQLSEVDSPIVTMDPELDAVPPLNLGQGVAE